MAVYPVHKKLTVRNQFQPDIVMFQNADGNFTGQFNTKATLKSSGEVEWSCPMIFRSSCQIDVTYFPYDTQNCSLTFGSWTYDRKGTYLGARILGISFKVI